MLKNQHEIQYETACRLVRRQLEMLEDVLKSGEVGHHASRLFAVLAIRGILYNPEDGWQRIPLSELMTMTNSSRQAVIDSTRQLANLHLIDVELKGGRNHFRVLLKEAGVSNA